MGLGWLSGNRLMLVNHLGRVSGNPRRVIVEIVNHDPIDDGHLAVSGFGPTAAWYQNVLRTPNVTIQVGRRTIAATAAPVSADEGAELMARYAVRHPRGAVKQLCQIIGVRSRRLRDRFQSRRTYDNLPLRVRCSTEPTPAPSTGAAAPRGVAHWLWTVSLAGG